MHPLKNRKLSRRTVLRGLAGGGAISLALPPLEAMFNAHGDALAGGGALPKYFISHFFGNGLPLNQFEPSTTGPGFAASQTLNQMTSLVNSGYVNVCTGLANRSELGQTHHEGLCGFSGHTYIDRPDLPQSFASDWGGPTIDQVIADAIQASDPTTIPSIQVRISKFGSPADGGTTAEYISMNGTPDNLTALPSETNPIAVWNTIFGEFVAPENDSDLRLSILDFVKDDAEALRAQLGVADNQRIDAHFEGIFQLEDKINALPPSCTIPGTPTENNSDPNGSELLTVVNQVMADLIAMAFQCDVTRVASVMFLGIAGESNFGEVGAGTGFGDTHHNASHADNQLYRDGCEHIMGRLGDLAETLRLTPDLTGGNLLDNAIIYSTSDCSIGWTHAISRQPIVMLGHGRGYLANPGVHYQAIASGNPGSGSPTAGNMTDVLLAIAQNYDPAMTQIGVAGDNPMSTTPLTDILA